MFDMTRNEEYEREKNVDEHDNFNRSWDYTTFLQLLDNQWYVYIDIYHIWLFFIVVFVSVAVSVAMQFIF